MPDYEHPPQFAESSVTAMIGQINDFSGAEQYDTSTAGGTQQTIQANTRALPTEATRPIPVVIAGSRRATGIPFPGLREMMISAAIIQLAEQIPVDSRELQAQIITAARSLQRAGAEKVLRNQSPAKTHGAC